MINRKDSLRKRSASVALEVSVSEVVVKRLNSFRNPLLLHLSENVFDNFRNFDNLTFMPNFTQQLPSEEV